MNNYLFFVQNIIKKEEDMNTLYKIALTISIIGCINWGLVGLFNFNLVEAIFGVDALLTKVIYSFVGLAGIINIGLLLTPFTSNNTK